MMKSTKKCPLFSTISLAADGDEVAIEKILNHYDAYISKASLRPFYDEHGNMYEYYGAAEPPVRCGESHLSGLTEPPQFVY